MVDSVQQVYASSCTQEFGHSAAGRLRCALQFRKLQVKQLLFLYQEVTTCGCAIAERRTLDSTYIQPSYYGFDPSC
jgi:hypothetical protein